MESDTVLAGAEPNLVPEAPRAADHRAGARVRRWLEEAWRHGEIVADDEALAMRGPARPSSRFDTAQRETEPPEPTLN